jgi:quinol monooxygenase YgiN
VSGPLVYVDTSEVRDRALQDLKGALDELVRFVEANEPEILAYNAYLSDDGTRMTVVHVHRDSASLEFHMDVAEPAFRRFVDLVTLTSITVYGEPSERVLEKLRGKARLLGGERVSVQRLHAGFTRFVGG